MKERSSWQNPAESLGTLGSVIKSTEKGGPNAKPKTETSRGGKSYWQRWVSCRTRSSREGFPWILEISRAETIWWKTSVWEGCRRAEVAMISPWFLLLSFMKINKAFWNEGRNKNEGLELTAMMKNKAFGPCGEWGKWLLPIGERTAN